MSRRFFVMPLAAAVLFAFLGGCADAPVTIADVPWHAIDAGGKAAPGDSGAEAVTSGDCDLPDCRPWRYIVIHHSAGESGSASAFDALHRERGWDGLGYHFVIDNGNGGPDGRVEVGQRWQLQKWGAHTGGTPDNAYNNFGIGICLVGDFTRHAPSQAQLASLDRLVSDLCRKYGIAPQDVIGHRDAPDARTECPGDMLYSYVHGTLRTNLEKQ